MILNVDLLPKKLNEINHFLKEEKGCSLYSYAEKNEERQNVIIVRLEDFDIAESFTTDSKTLNMLRVLNPAEIIIKDNLFVIKSPKGNYCSRLLNNDGFFKPNLDVNNKFITNIEYLNKATAYVSKNEKKPILTGVRLDSNGNIYATDSFRVYSKIVGDFSADGITMTVGFIKTINDVIEGVSKGGSLEIQYNKNNAIVTKDNITIVGRLLDGAYPTIEKVIQSKSGAESVEINQDEFVEALTISQNVTADNENGTIIILRENRFTAEGKEKYENRITFKNEGKYYLAVTQKALLQALATYRGERFSVEVLHKDSMGQILFITNENEGNETILILGIKRESLDDK